MNNQRFTDAFECEAVRLVSQAGISKEEISKDLGIKANVLHPWVREQEGNTTKIAGRKNEAVSSEEFERMRRELAKVRTELQLRLLRRDWNNLIAFPARLAPPLVMPVSRSLIS